MASVLLPSSRLPSSGSDFERGGDRPAALKAPLYRRYWLGSMGAVGATQLVMTAMSWLVFSLSGSAADLAILGMAASLPTIIVVVVVVVVGWLTNWIGAAS